MHHPPLEIPRLRAMARHALPNLIEASVIPLVVFYGALWLVGDALALRHGGVRISDSGLDVAVGARWRAHLPWADIVALHHGDVAAPDGALRASIVEANLVVALTRPLPVHGPFGIVRHARSIALTVDRGADFAIAAQAAQRAYADGCEPA